MHKKKSCRNSGPSYLFKDLSFVVAEYQLKHHFLKITKDILVELSLRSWLTCCSI